MRDINLKRFLGKNILLVFVLGGFLTFLSGFIENNPGIGVPETNYFGYPLAWRVVDTFQQQEVILENTLIDLLFWIVIAYFLVSLFNRLDSSFSEFLVFGVFVVFCGFFMDLVHEFGHVIWGLLVGGELNLLKIGFLEIYPVPRFVSDFELGKAALSGFESDFSRGIYLLGGSLTTNLVSWVFTVVKDRNIFFIISGIFGLLDLPLYVFLPQIGLRHWIFLGSRMPEPLLAIELIRFPKELFYLLILFSTVILLYLYLGGIEAFSLSEV